MKTMRLSAVVFCAWAMLPCAFAQESQPVNHAFNWRFSASAEVFSQSQYVGGAQQSKGIGLGLLPSASYGSFYIGSLPGANLTGSGAPPPGVGMWLTQNDTCHIAAGLTAGSERLEKAATRLAGMGDIEPSANAFVNSACGSAHLLTKATLSTDLNGHGQGTRLSLDLLARHSATPQWMMYAGPGLNWGDKTFNQTFFGVTPTQNARSGIAVYEARSGVHLAHLTAGLLYLMDSNWTLYAEIQGARITGQVINSPIIEKRAQMASAAGFFYSF